LGGRPPNQEREGCWRPAGALAVADRFVFVVGWCSFRGVGPPPTGSAGDAHKGTHGRAAAGPVRGRKNLVQPGHTESGRLSYAKPPRDRCIGPASGGDDSHGAYRAGGGRVSDQGRAGTLFRVKRGAQGSWLNGPGANAPAYRPLSFGDSDRPRTSSSTKPQKNLAVWASTRRNGNRRRTIEWQGGPRSARRRKAYAGSRWGRLRRESLLRAATKGSSFCRGPRKLRTLHGWTATVGDNRQTGGRTPGPRGRPPTRGPAPPQFVRPGPPRGGVTDHYQDHRADPPKSHQTQGSRDGSQRPSLAGRALPRSAPTGAGARPRAQGPRGGPEAAEGPAAKHQSGNPGAPFPRSASSSGGGGKGGCGGGRAGGGSAEGGTAAAAGAQGGSGPAGDGEPRWLGDRTSTHSRLSPSDLDRLGPEALPPTQGGPERGQGVQLPAGKEPWNGER